MVFLVDSHGICYLFCSPGTKYAIGFCESVEAVSLSKDDEMGLRAQSRNECLIGLQRYNSGDVRVTALERHFSYDICLLNARVKESGHIVENKHEIGVYTEGLGESVVFG